LPADVDDQPHALWLRVMGSTRSRYPVPCRIAQINVAVDDATDQQLDVFYGRADANTQGTPAF
jgi:hypothetical protein